MLQALAKPLRPYPVLKALYKFFQQLAHYPPNPSAFERASSLVCGLNRIYDEPRAGC